jgi:surface protein
MQSRGMKMGTRVCSCVRVRSRAGADDALIRGMCGSATRSLRNAIHRSNTHTHSVRIHNACMYLYPCAAGYTDERIADAGPPHTRAHVLRPCARACARAVGGPSIRAGTCERLAPAWTAGGSARQAFQFASAFNANIGAWNTASVTDLSMVCAALFGPGGAPPQAGRAWPGGRCV